MLQVDNQTDTELTIGGFKGSDRAFGSQIASPYSWHWASPYGGPISVDLGESHGYVTVIGKRIEHWVSLPSSLQQDTFGINIGPFSEDDYIAITKRDGHLQWVDWNAVQAKWKGQTQRAPAVGNTGRPDLGLDRLRSELASLSTSIASLGPEAALPAQALYSVASIILAVFDQHHSQPPPPPPTVDQIVEGIRAVLVEELDRHHAEEYAPKFLSVPAWLGDWISKAHAAIYGSAPTSSQGELAEHDLKDFLRDLHAYASKNGDFQSKLDEMATRPEGARYILPAFGVGITACLEVMHIHDLVRSCDGVRLTDEDLKQFCDRATFLTASMESAANSFRQLVASKVRDAKLENTTLGNQLTSIITSTFTGSDSLSFVDDVKSKIARIVDLVTTDVNRLKAGQSAEHYQKPEWSNHPRPRGKPQSA